MSLWDGDMQEGGLHGHRDMQWACQLAPTQGPPWQGPAPTCTGTEDSALETPPWPHPLYFFQWLFILMSLVINWYSNK